MLEIVIALYKKAVADFADCVHIASAHATGEDSILTLYKLVANIKNVSLLKV